MRKWPAFRPVNGGWESWCLEEPMRINGLQVPEGFETDFASVPGSDYLRRLWPAAVGHDYLYRMQPAGWTRAKADLWFRDTMIQVGVPRWRAYRAWMAVRAFGGRPWAEAAESL